MSIETTQEGIRLANARLKKAPWRLWGPYLSERQWGTVREDYSHDGSAWEYLPHDHARSRAYRWGEDGIAGICDDKQQLCFSLALWNGKDPCLKERLFGLTGHEGNHGEDVKEYYFYLDNVPTHSYMKYLYKYPQRAFPYDDLVATNKKRSRLDPEYELLDTGIFDDNRYYDVFTEYVKVSCQDLLIRFTIANRGPEVASLYLLPTLWFRNTWSWSGGDKPSLSLDASAPLLRLKAFHQTLGNYSLYSAQGDFALFTENETNTQRLFGSPNSSPYSKDSINDYFIHNKTSGISQNTSGTKAAIVHHLHIPPGEQQVIKLRLSNNSCLSHPFSSEFDETFANRKNEADAFYLAVTPYSLPDDMRHVQRQAFAGLLWNKQCYHYNVKKWLKGDPNQPPPPKERLKGRNWHWPYLDAYDILSLPDKWEYPWFASWDLAFHTITLAMIDPEFAKEQLLLLTREWYMGPDGQIPAYEWDFSDANPPVHAWAAMRVYQIEKAMYGREDRSFLERTFQKLLLNFTWWVNRKDAEGRNIFEGGFLGLDNIGAFNRSVIAPSVGILEEADATGWMGMYCLNCLEIALELAGKNPVYEDIATKFFEHFVYIGNAINSTSDEEAGLWDLAKKFYYSLLRLPSGKLVRLYQDNVSNIIPLFAVATSSSHASTIFPDFRKRFHWLVENCPDMLRNIANLKRYDTDGKLLLAFADEHRLPEMLQKLLDETQFLSPHGIRSTSKRLQKNPFSICLGGETYSLDYEPAESTTPLFGGNSNWRGPVWFPLNFLVIESLQKFHYYYGDTLKVEFPTGSGNKLNLWDIASQISHRLITLFLKDSHERRPVYGAIEKFQSDPHWRDYLLFHEYFHGDNGAGLGASNQTGWTSLVAKLIHQYGKYALQHIPPRSIEKENIDYL